MKGWRAWARYLAITGNVVYFFWILWNAIDEGFNAGLVQRVSGLGMLVLLTLNVVLLVGLRDRPGAA